MADNLLDKASILLTPTAYNDGSMLSVKPENGDGDFQFSRSSAATRVNAQGLVEEITDTDLPRIDYTDGCGSWLLEPQSTNLITYSEDFSQSSWANSNISEELSSVLSPDGTSYSYKLTNDAVTGNHILRDTITVTSGQAYTLSLFIKKGTRDIVSIADGFNVNVLANFDLTNGSVTNVFATSSSIESFNNGWYRCMATITPSTALLSLMIFSGTTYAGTDESGDFYIWGAQVEQQSYATSYIPTNGATSTRLQDIANNSGNSTLINSTEGVLYAEIAALTNGGSNRIVRISDGGGNTNAIEFRYAPDDYLYYDIWVGGSSQFSGYYASFTQSDVNKIAIKYKENDFALWVNGTEVATDSSGVTFSNNTLDDLSFIRGSLFPFFGKAKALAVFPILTDAELQSLTTI